MENLGHAFKNNMNIVKKNKGYQLRSKRTGRNLGTSSTQAGAQKREREVQYFKHLRSKGGY